MKEKLQRFMYGRYGLDSFGKFTEPGLSGKNSESSTFLRLTEKYNGTEKDTSHLQMSDL